MIRKFNISLLIILLLCSYLHAQKKVALIIGNNSYKLSPLKYPVSDANAIASALRELDFRVTIKTNLNKQQMIRTLNTFSNKLTAEDIVLFYYSGHSFQFNGNNYLIPIEVNITQDDDIKFETISLNRLLDKCKIAKSKIFILDACRENPYYSSNSSSKGLNELKNISEETLIAFSAAPHKTALEGDGMYSYYLKHLIYEMMNNNDITIEEILRNVSSKVKIETDNFQDPYFVSSISNELTLKKQENKLISEENFITHQKKSKNIKDMIFIKGGTFKMGNRENADEGDEDEKPVHLVTLNDFYICKYEVTQEEWEKIMGNNPSYFFGEKNLPVENISWFDAIEFCNRKSEISGLESCYTVNGENISCDFSADGYRLPTESEWEFAARGGIISKGYKYSGSSKIAEVAWFTKTTNDKGTKPVGGKKANELGLYDMSGNVWEWCWDSYEKYTSDSQHNPKGTNKNSDRIYRGGCWNFFARYCRNADRASINPTACYYGIGFRLVRSSK